MRFMVAIVLVFVLITFHSQANAITIEFLEDTYTFSDEEREVIQSIADATEIEVRELLPALDEDLVLIVTAGKYVIAHTGEGGMALAAGRVQWTVDPERAGGVVTIAKAQLRHTLYHEFHHLVRGWLIQGGRPKTSFMVGVVSEGMATAFARDFSGEKVPWGKYPDDVEDWVSELQDLATAAQYNEWMFLHPDGRQWIGYRAGTYLVDRATKASGKTAVEMVTTPADEVIELGVLSKNSAEPESGQF